MLPHEGESRPSHNIDNAFSVDAVTTAMLHDPLFRAMGVLPKHEAAPLIVPPETTPALPKAEVVTKVEAAPKPEVKVPIFDQVVFGHPFAGFDRDQLIAYYLALKLGSISAETPVNFTLDPTDQDFTNESTMVIESYRKPENIKNLQRQGNYLTGENDKPAAVVFFEYLSRQFNQLEHVEALRELVNWLKSADTHATASQREIFSSDVLSVITPIFYALKLETKDPQELLKKSVEMLDLALTHPQAVDKLVEKYESELTALRDKRNTDFQKLRERAQNKDYLRQTQTLNGTKLAYFDIRGLNIESGGLTVASQETGADVVLLIDEIQDPENTEHQLGTQFIFKLVTEKEELKDAIASLADRMQTSEMLFGKGFKVKGSYGGHPGLVSSPAWVGSELAPENVWVALQKYLNVPRYSETTFRQKAEMLATRLGIERANLLTYMPPNDEYTLAEWQLRFSIPHNNEFHLVTLPESDLLLYEELFTDDPAKNRRLLLEKTDVSEAAEIVNYRMVQAEYALPSILREKQATSALILIDDLNTASVEELTLETQLALLETVSQDSLAIDQVWNKDNMVFRIVANNLPDWIKSNLDVYKEERFKYVSLPSKIDSTLIKSVIEKATKNHDQMAFSRLAKTLVSILTSEKYQSSHREGGFDFLLQNCVEVCVDHLNPAEARSLLSILDQQYGQHMIHEWRRLPLDLVAQVKTDFPGLLEFIPMPTEVERRDARKSFMTITPPTPEKIQAHGKDQVLLIQVGRSIRENFLQKGFVRYEVSRRETKVIPPGFTSEILVRNTLNFDPEIAQDRILIQEVLSQIEMVLQNAPDAKVLLVAGGFPGILLRKLGVAIPIELRSKISFCDYNQLTGKFIENPME